MVKVSVEGWGREKDQIMLAGSGRREERRYSVPMEIVEFAAHWKDSDGAMGGPSCVARFQCGCLVVDGGLVRCKRHSRLVSVALEVNCW